MMMPAETYEKMKDTIIWAYAVPEDRIPPAPPPPAPKTEMPEKTVTAPDPLITGLPQPMWDRFETRPVTVDPDLTAGPIPLTPPGTREPVLIAARPDPSRLGDFQPAYPASMIRQQVEGFAKVRVHIAISGRVDAVELIECTDEAFWKATREQALRRWRFTPATRDGIAIPAEQVMTVRFRLSDIG